ncbi:hypothetical protein COB64_01915 [Candidatus Wolfebacteria bacterium]|nr:MAG: hypothetical protein COB64_01915 [Candidatus Wolfebacteria bacterium]
MKKIVIFLSIFYFSINFESNAQNGEDAIVVVEPISPIGTAAYIGSAGSNVGDTYDPSYINNGNPAVIGLAKKSGFSFSPAVFMQGSSSFYPGKIDNETQVEIVSSDNSSNFGFSNLSGVFSLYEEGGIAGLDGWEALNVGFSLNRQNNFHFRSKNSVSNEDNSLIDVFMRDAHNSNGVGIDVSMLDPTSSAALAFEALLIQPDPGGKINDETVWYSIVPNAGVFQHHSSETTGKLWESALSVGSSYNDKFYLGLAFAMQRGFYSREISHKEVDQNNEILFFKSFLYTQSVLTTIQGYNVKVGFMAKPIYWLRVGGSFKAPSVLTMTESDASTITPEYDDNRDLGTIQSRLRETLYQTSTPMNFAADVTVLIWETAAIGLTYKWINYQNVRLRSTSSFFDENDDIQSTYKNTSNIGIGGRADVGKIFTVRAGYKLSGSPAHENPTSAKSSKLDAAFNKSSLSAGFGFHGFLGGDDDGTEIFLDFAFVSTKFKSLSSSYDLEGAYVNENHSVFNTGVVTFGVNF